MSHDYRNEKLQQRATSAASKFLRSHPSSTIFEREEHAVRLAKRYGYDGADVHWFWQVFTDHLPSACPNAQ